MWWCTDTPASSSTGSYSSPDRSSSWHGQIPGPPCATRWWHSRHFRSPVLTKQALHNLRRSCWYVASRGHFSHIVDIGVGCSSTLEFWYLYPEKGHTIGRYCCQVVHIHGNLSCSKHTSVMMYASSRDKGWVRGWGVMPDSANDNVGICEHSWLTDI
jgi:hypothetical protein